MANDQASTSSAVDTGLCADAERSFFDNVPDFVTPLPPLDAPDDVSCVLEMRSRIWHTVCRLVASSAVAVASRE
jgi:hypothetical protein